MREITQLERVRFSQFLIDVVNGIDALLNDRHPEDLTKINTFIPKYVAQISYSIEGSSSKNDSERYFTYLDHKFKGKKRVYVSMDRFKNDLYMFYLSKERLIKMLDNPDHLKWIGDIISNRWLITVGSYKFKDVFQLLTHLVAAESLVSRANKPPTSDHPLNNWRAMDVISSSISKYRDVGNPYRVASCVVQEFDFSRKLDTIFS